MTANKLILILIACAVFTSCETTKLVYKTTAPTEWNRLGIADLNKKSPKIDSIFPKLDSSFNAASLKYANRFLAKEVIHLDHNLSCHQPDSLKIMVLCAEKKLDGIVLTYVDFRLVLNQIYFITTDKHFECVLYSKIYDKNGRMLYSVVHDSKNDSYDKIPNTYDVVNLATGISYKKIYTTRLRK
jgi:hypothetical protein